MGQISNLSRRVTNPVPGSSYFRGANKVGPLSARISRTLSLSGGSPSGFSDKTRVPNDDINSSAASRVSSL